MEFFSIASGSSGNCLCGGDLDTHILIDAGISGKKIEEGLNSFDLSCRDISGILVTHEHSDHICGLGVLARRYGIPIYLSNGTYEAISTGGLIGKVDEGLFHVISPDQTFNIGDLQIEAMSISHDAAQPVAYTLQEQDVNGLHKLGVVTDLGTYNQYIESKIKDANVLLVEANHDVNMLQVGSYPYPLKQRILSDRGHLSNEASGRLLSDIVHDDLKKIYLGHLSGENNYPELAFEAVKIEISTGDNPYSGYDFDIEVALRHKASSKIEF